MVGLVVIITPPTIVLSSGDEVAIRSILEGIKQVNHRHAVLA